MKTKHIIAIVIGALVGIPVLVGTTGLVAAIVAPNLMSQSDKAKEASERLMAVTQLKEAQVNCLEIGHDYDYCQEEYDRSRASLGY